MNIVHYVDNHGLFVAKKGTFYTTKSEKQAGWTKLIQPLTLSGGWFPQALLSCFGIFLITISFFPGFVFAKGPATISVSNYPPRLAENTPLPVSTPTSVAVTTAQVKAEEITLANTTSTAQSFSGRRLWPVRGNISTYFWGGHPAIDIAATYGASVTAFSDGVVILVAQQSWGFGNHIVIRHADGLVTTYAHLSTLNVSKGQTVAAGSLIGRVGSSGYATGSHLHFQVDRAGVSINPLSVLP